MSGKINLDPFDRIKSQADRFEALEAALSTAQQVIYDLTEGITGTAQRDRIEALEAALREIASPVGCIRMTDARDIARAALERK